MPDKINFHFENINGVIEKLIVFFIFKSKIKNNFTIGPKVSNNSGDIILTKKSVEEIIALSKNSSPMDYGGELSDCDLLSIVVETRSELEERITRLNEFYPNNALALQKILESASNDERSLNKEIKMPIQNMKIFLRID